MALEDAYKQFDEAAREAVQWLNSEVASIRSGRVKPDAVSSLAVEHYGTRNQLQAMASIANVDARTLMISPWDVSALSAIEKALTAAELGVQPVTDGKVIRLVFPSMTEEVREQTVKQLQKKGEEARIRLRQARDEALRLIREAKDAGDLTEDDFYDGRTGLDKRIDATNKEIEALIAKKEAEITSL